MPGRPRLTAALPRRAEHVLGLPVDDCVLERVESHGRTIPGAPRPGCVQIAIVVAGDAMCLDVERGASAGIDENGDVVTLTAPQRAHAARVAGRARRAAVRTLLARKVAS